MLFEGEETLCELADAIKCEKDWRAIDGIAYRCNGRIHANRNRPLVKDLDQFSFPARDDLR